MSVEAWIEAQRPPVPEGFRPWLVEALAEAPVDQAALRREAVAALDRSARGEGARGGAFELLVADALVTWAAQDLLDGPEAELRLEELVRALAG